MDTMTFSEATDGHPQNRDQTSNVAFTPDRASVNSSKSRPRSSMASAESLIREASIEDDNAPPPPYSVFIGWERYSIVAMVAVASLLSPLTANVYFPAIPQIANAFHVSVERINLTVTVYMIVQGLSPSLWGFVADRKGRRPTFVICMIILLGSTVGLALVPTSAYWLLLALRLLQAAGSASTVALAAGVMTDVIPTELRGGYIGIASIGPMIGPCVGPVIGGVLANKFGWRSIFWFLVIATGVCCLVILLFFPETLRSLVGNGSIPPPQFNRAFIPIIGQRNLKMSSERPPIKALPNPFKLFTAPDIIIILISSAIPYSAFYAVNTTISLLFAEIYPFLTETEIGLCFLGLGGGGALAAITVGKLLDVQFRTTRRKMEHVANDSSETLCDISKIDRGIYDDFPIEEARLKTQFIWIWIFSITCIGYGWCLQAKTSIAVPLFLQFILGYSIIAVMTNTGTLIVDLFPTQGSSITAANNLVRCLMGAATVSVINPITNALGPGWTYTLCGGICVLTWPMVLVELQFGPKWRRRRMERSRQSE